MGRDTSQFREIKSEEDFTKFRSAIFWENKKEWVKDRSKRQIGNAPMGIIIGMVVVFGQSILAGDVDVHIDTDNQIAIENVNRCGSFTTVEDQGVTVYLGKDCTSAEGSSVELKVGKKSYNFHMKFATGNEFWLVPLDQDNPLWKEGRTINVTSKDNLPLVFTIRKTTLADKTQQVYLQLVNTDTEQ